MDASTQVVRVGAAQVAEVYLDRQATTEKDCEFIERAGELDLDLLVFPEFHIPSRPTWYRYVDVDFGEYYKRLFEEAVTVPGPMIDRLSEAAEEAAVAVVIGVNEKEPGTAGTLYNSLVCIDADGTLVGVRRKIMPTRDERMFHAGGSGKDVRTFDTTCGTIGALACGENKNHLLKFALLALDEEIHAASWPAFPYYDRDEREAQVCSVAREQAIAGQVPVVVATGVLTDELAAAVGIEEMSRDSGTSAVVDIDGTYRVGPKWNGEGIVHAEIDMDERVRAKGTIDVVGHYNRFDIFNLRIDRRPQEPIRFVDDSEDIDTERL